MNEKNAGCGERERKSEYQGSGHNLHVRCQVLSHFRAQGSKRSNVRNSESLVSKLHLLEMQAAWDGEPFRLVLEP
jgi:hypothetical protein